MYIKNTSSHGLKEYEIQHTWDKDSQLLRGKNLKPQAITNHFKEIKSGYGSYDHYTIDVTFDDPSSSNYSSHFYYNSLWKHDKVILDIHDDHIDCSYIKDAPEQQENNHRSEQWQ